MRNNVRNFLEKTLEGWGFVKRAAVALSTSAGFNQRDYPNRKTADMLRAYAGWVFACVKARARDVSHIELELYRVVNRATGEVEEITEHDVLSLLRSVNPFMTFRQLVEHTRAYLDITGNAFWWLKRAGNNGSGPIMQIWPLRPDWVEIQTTTDGFIAGYVYKVPGQEAVPFRKEEIIHHKEFNPVNPYRGMGVIEAAAVTIDSESYAEEYNKNFFRNSAVPEVVLETDQKLTLAQVNRMHAEWAAKYGGQQNAHKTAILEGGLKVSPFSVSQKDMEFLGGMGYSRDKIFAMFEVPKSRIGMTEGVTVSNAEATINIYLKYLVKPLMEHLTDTLTEFLLPLYPNTQDLFFDFDDPVPEDIAAETEAMKADFAMGAITSNEIRIERGRDEVPGLDNFYVSATQVSIASEGTPNPNAPETMDDDEEKSVAVRLPVQTKAKLRRRKRVRALPMRLKDRFAARVSEQLTKAVTKTITEHFVKGMSKELKSVKNEDLGQNHWPAELKSAYWKSLVGKTNNYEKLYEAKLVELFDGQERRVLDNLTTVEGKSIEKFSQAEIESILISVAAENKVAADLLLPLVRQIVEESGSDALDFVSQEATFDAQSAAVQQFMRAEALRGIRKMNKTTKSALRKLLSQALKDGLGPVETGRNIRGLFTDAKNMRAKRIARTETLKAANYGALEAYKQSGVVAGKQWLTAEDETVCQWCGPLDGKTQSLDNNFFHQGETYVGNKGGALDLSYDAIPAPPLHVNCRCTLVPITVSQ